MRTMKEVAELVGVSYASLHLSHWRGYIPDPPKIGNTRIYSEEDIERVRQWYAQHPYKSKTKDK